MKTGKWFKRFGTFLMTCVLSVSMIAPSGTAHASGTVSSGNGSAQTLSGNPEGVKQEEGSVSQSDLPGVSQGNLLSTLALSQEERHIATYVGQVPAGVEWADDVDASDFLQAFASVKVKDVLGNEYTVEVVPEGIVYFLDMGATDNALPYRAVKNLAGNSLLNEKTDQESDGSAWGHKKVDTYTAKGNVDDADKTMTGVYGSNATGSALTYYFPLKAGTYTLTSCHNDWWSMNRPMSMSLKTSAGTVDAGAVQATGVNSFSFKLDQDETVEYVINNTGTEASIVSWIAVQQVYVQEVYGPVEDLGGISVRNGASLVADYEDGVMASVDSGWISGGNSPKDGGAVFNEASLYFQRDSFTLYTDMNIAEVHNNTSAVLIGTEKNHIRLIPRMESGKAVLRIAADGAVKDYELASEIALNEWNALALVYSENGTEGLAAVYLNGEEVLAAVPTGFKMSGLNGVTAGYGITYGTGFMRTGKYDNIVVMTSAAGADAARAETQARKSVMENRRYFDGSVNIKGSDVDAANAKPNGLAYKGWGMLNGNSTSNLLMDYKADHPDEYWDMMEYLFGGEYPLFTHIKMEMGNDGNNSTGAEACTMRYEEEEADASRSPGFQMAADAKAINPDVKVSILYWERPKWINDSWNGQSEDSYEKLYKWFSETIFDAYEKYGYVVDFVNPDKNETSDPNSKLIKWFEAKLENETEFPDYMDAAAQEMYHNIRIIASDENKSLNIVPKMLSDNDLLNAVDIIGFHYRTNATADYIKMADEYDKEVWYSEACATFGYTEQQENKIIEYGGGTIGGYQSPLSMIDGYLNSFTASRRTHYIFQPAIGAFYEGIQYGHKELLSARDPWSGYIHYDPALYMIGHFSKFAKTGWENEDNTNGIWRAIPQASFGSFGGSDSEHATAGIDGNGSFMTLAAPDKSDYSVVFINNTRNEKSYRIRAVDMNVAADAQLQVWETATDSYMQQLDPVEAEDGCYYITIKPYTVVTATTLGAEVEPERAPEDGERTVLDTDSTGKNPDTEDTFLYADNFDYKEEPDLPVSKAGQKDAYTVPYLEARGGEPRYMLDTHGAWVVENGLLKQELGYSVGQWNGGDPSTIVGDFRWMNYKASIDVIIPKDPADGSENTWAGIGIRTQSGMNWNNSGYTLHIERDGDWNFYRVGTKIKGGKVENGNDGKYNLQLEGKGDTITGYIDGVEIFSYTDPNPMDAGRVKLSCAWKTVYFDNLKVENIEGYIPYAIKMADSQDDEVTYEGSWKMENPGSGSADNWYRTVSSNKEANASFSFPINGTGFSIIGENAAGVKLDIYVDDMALPYKTDVAGTAISKRYPTYTLDGLSDGSHTIKVVVKEGTLNIDALYTLGAPLTALRTVTFESNGGTGLEDVSIREGRLLARPEDPSKEGYDFKGWYQDEECTVEYDFSVPVSGDFTLYAKWEEIVAPVEKVTVSFDTDGGSQASPVELEKGAKLEKPADPVKDGYAFKGWYTDEECTQEYDFSAPVVENTTLYAKWEEKQQDKPSGEPSEEPSKEPSGEPSDGGDSNGQDGESSDQGGNDEDNQSSSQPAESAVTSPKTGDGFNMIQLVIIVIAALAGMTLISSVRRFKGEDEEL